MQNYSSWIFYIFTKPVNQMGLMIDIIIKTVFCLCFVFSIVSCNYAAPSQESRVSRLVKMANNGNATAQTELGSLYERGIGMPRNPEDALMWYQLAAKQGNSLAEFHIGSLYERGSGVQKNFEKAVYWYEKASNKGNKSAMAALAYLYDRGLGVNRNFSEARLLYDKATTDSKNSMPKSSKALSEVINTDGSNLSNANLEQNSNRGPTTYTRISNAPAIEIDLSAIDRSFTKALNTTTNDSHLNKSKQSFVHIIPDRGAHYISLGVYPNNAVANQKWKKINEQEPDLLTKLAMHVVENKKNPKEQRFQLIIGPINSVLRVEQICNSLYLYVEECKRTYK
jgi:hypothetical protein